MNESLANAMDNIVVRPLKFDCNDIKSEDTVWSRSHPLFSIYINALGIHVPYFERYLVAGLRQARKEIDDNVLQKDVSRIIGQEAHHAKNFVEINKFLALRYPEVSSLDANAKNYFEERIKEDNLKSLLGYIAGYETFTYLGGMIILKNYDKWMKNAEPVMRSAWVWHQVEEVEHGAVAFDVYQYFFKENEWYRKWMILKAFIHIGQEIVKAYIPMVKKEGYFKNMTSTVKAVGFLFSFTARLAYSALPTLFRNYHPKNHPMCSTDQSPIAIAWRKHHAEGNNVTKLDDTEMGSIRSHYSQQ